MRVFYKGRDNKKDMIVYFSKYDTAVKFLKNHKDNYEYFKILNKNDKVDWKNLKGMCGGSSQFEDCGKGNYHDDGYDMTDYNYEELE